MDSINKSPNTTQLVMNGMFPSNVTSTNTSPTHIVPGGVVIYSGNVAGGPSHGVHGVIQSVTNRTAIVNLGRDGTWYIPYFCLSVASAASGKAA